MVEKQCLISIVFLIVVTISGAVTDVPNNDNKKSSFNEKSVEIAAKKKEILPDETHFGREHVTNKTPSKNINLTSNVTTKQSSNKITNMTSETRSFSGNNMTKIVNKITDVPKAKIQIDSTKNNISTSNVEKTLPSSTKKIQSSTLKSKPTSTIKPIAKKPLITVHDDDADKINSSADDNNSPPYNIININPLLSEKNHKRSNYVVPIVAVILSVPLVAGLISILYKKGKDWWLHRNYRRMDYLIEGLYNS